MSSNRYTRRRVLGSAAGVAGAAVGLNLLPGAVQAALAADRPRGGFDAIEHVVLLMQENRSFDSYFGTFPGADGFPTRHGAISVCVPDPRTHTCVKPYPDNDDVNFGGPHGRGSAIVDRARGAMNGFVRALQHATLRCRGGNDPD